MPSITLPNGVLLQGTVEEITCLAQAIHAGQIPTPPEPEEPMPRENRGTKHLDRHERYAQLLVIFLANQPGYTTHREICKTLRLAYGSVTNYLTELHKFGLIRRFKPGINSGKWVLTDVYLKWRKKQLAFKRIQHPQDALTFCHERNHGVRYTFPSNERA